MMLLMYPAPMPACCMAVASMLTWMEGDLPARRSRSKRGGITTTNMKLPRSISACTSPGSIVSGSLNRRKERVEQLFRERGAVFDDEGNRGVVHLARGAG